MDNKTSHTQRHRFILAPTGGASKLSDALSVSLDYLVGKTDVQLDKNILDKVVSIQKLPEEDKNCIMYSIDGLIQHAKTRQAYK
ncbi:MAG TPA: hypothetical protein VLB84_01505 [Bacteroidia bacterium]|nr:hypothetical protein [Bacteroidia bacterium]